MLFLSDYAYDYARPDEQKQPEKATFFLDGQQGNIANKFVCRMCKKGVIKRLKHNHFIFVVQTNVQQQDCLNHREANKILVKSVVHNIQIKLSLNISHKLNLV